MNRAPSGQKEGQLKTESDDKKYQHDDNAGDTTHDDGIEQNKQRRRRIFTAMNRRQRTLFALCIALILILGIVTGGLLLSNDNLMTHFEDKNLSPSIDHPFGTDWLGRDMLTRTLKGLILSFLVGLTASVVSAAIAMILGTVSATMGKWADSIVTWFVDIFLGIPHIVALILIAFVLGGGATGVIVGVALTHWPSLTRVIRAEVLQLREAEFVQVSRHLGRSRLWIARKHMLPHLMPQFLVGLVLLFPHAILHEASITFLGFGLTPHKPAIGVILSESMRYLSTGRWWLALFPGLALLVMVRAFDVVGDNLRALIDPHTAQE